MKQCYFCTNNMNYLDYKNVEMLKRFLNPHARIMGHNRTGICSRHQRKLAMSVKHARFLGLLPYIAR
ncbi:MAG TPA: 30S ribosomal protein S18 [Nitrososphaera sp.]|nr:30S ribosomal protein S18 [Nitrososphaera sp.]